IKTTEIDIPSYMRNDNVVNVSIDRMKGNPNRTVEIALYEFESEGEVEIVKNNTIAFNKPQTSSPKLQTNLTINNKLSTIDLQYSIPKDGNINIRIFDITGRVIETVHSGHISKGKYTYNPKNTKNGIYFAVMEYEGEMYKEKIISIK
ncbi:T9SS type A sorting domain-containing protein, partial [candidate division WOR-3 bacterium]|nr:T9SS type A sorting domain-containing protein [candidate division WOR-3 bacterium]